MNKKGTIPELMSGVVHEMEKLQYAQSTIDLFTHYCKQLSRFAIKTQGNDAFTEYICDEYLKERFQYPFVEGRPLSPMEANAVRCLRWLGEYNTYGGFTAIGRRQNISIEQWGLDDTKIIMSFVDGIQTTDNSEHTKEYRYHILHTFYAFLSPHNISGIKKLNHEVITSFIASLQGYAKTTIQHRLSCLKSFFHYVYKIGHCTIDWTYRLPTVKRAKNLTVPAIWSDDEIVLMLKTIDRASPVGKRNYAILLLVVQLGLRISDVSELTFSAFNWRTNTLSFIQKKLVRPITCSRFLRTWAGQ